MFNIISTCSIFESCSLVYNQCDHLYSNSSSHTRGPSLHLLCCLVLLLNLNQPRRRVFATFQWIYSEPRDIRFKHLRLHLRQTPLFFWSHLSRTYPYYILYHINNNLWSLQEIIFFSGHDLNLFHARHHHHYQYRIRLDWGYGTGRARNKDQSVTSIDHLLLIKTLCSIRITRTNENEVPNWYLGNKIN